MILIKCVLFKFAPIMPACCSFLLPSNYSNNYVEKINASLKLAHFKTCYSIINDASKTLKLLNVGATL